MKKRICLLLFIVLIVMTGCETKKKEENKKVMKTNGMLSYTIDGEKTDIKPTKEEGYIVNKIICDNGSDMMWDNDNWEVELTKVNSKDRCKIDFTKDTSKEGYRVTVTSNVISALDSLSKATTENGTVKIYSKSKIKSVTGCTGIIEDNKVIINNVTTNQTCNIMIERTLTDVIKIAYPPKGERTDFTLLAEDIETGLYTGIDGQGTTYYFSGDGTSMNNWVSFAGSMWRIIRINGNGSVRLLYAGDGNTGSEANNYNGVGSDNGKSTYSIDSNTYSHPAYVGWKYTVGGSLAADRENSTESGAYKAVNSWYISNIIDADLTNYIDKEVIYCCDRNIGSKTYSTSSKFYYEAYTRLNTNKLPTFECFDSSDIFTTFGLMTADEVSFSGGIYNQTSSKAYYFLNITGSNSITGDQWWWTMTPNRWNSDDKFALVLIVDGFGNNSGRMRETYVGNKNGIVRPVISLKSEVIVTNGDGSGSNPYTVTLP